MQKVAKSFIKPLAQQRLDTKSLSFSLRRLVRVCVMWFLIGVRAVIAESSSGHFLQEVSIKEAQEEALPLHQV